jgi:hypothetical protein
MPASGSPELSAFSIDAPVPGDERPDWTLDVRGWAIGADRPVVAVEGAHDGVRLWQAPLDVARPAAAADHGAADEHIGFRAHTSTLPLATDFELALQAVFEDGARAAIGTIRGRRDQLRPSFEPRRRPVLVTTLGRTGSMLLLRLLSFHPDVLVYRPHRFEQRIASYWADVLISLAEPRAFLRQIAPPPDVEDPVWWLGHEGPVPWGLRDEAVVDWLGGDSVEAIAASCMERIEATYDRIATTTDAGDARLFAEKANLRAAGMLRELYPGAKELFLVRDFRDMVSSILAFNEKRGAQGFGRAAAQSDAGYVDSLAGWASALVRAWERRRGEAHLVRYEDLVTDPERSLAEVYAYLGVDASAAAAMVARLGEAMPELRDHRTSDGASASVGRWQQDLPPDLVAACEGAFGEALAAFGYA